MSIALHPWTEPAERVLVEATRTCAGVVLPRPGQRFLIDQVPEIERWWPELPWRSGSEAPIVSSLSEAG